MSKPTMSLEAAADEERRLVLTQLEGKPKSPRRAESPVVPVRSMLDVSSGPVPRHGSIAGIGVGITAGASGPQSPTYRSMLDITSPITSPSQQPIANPLSFPLTAQTPKQEQRRSSVDSLSRPGAPRAMAAAISGDLGALPGFSRTKESRHSSAMVGGSSTSPSSRTTPRSQSPGGNTLSIVVPAASLPPNAYVTDSGKVVDMDKAYRKLSNKSHESSSFSTVNNEEGDNARVHKDALVNEDNEAAVEDSDTDEEPSTDEDELTSEASRGRRRSRRKKGSTGSEGDRDDSEAGTESTLGMGQAHGPREARSLMAAAEEERELSLPYNPTSAITDSYLGKKVSSHYPVKSLLEPSIAITTPTGEKLTPKKAGVFPQTSFDQNPASVASSAASSEFDGDFSDIKRAQKMSINVSQLDTTVPNRAIRTILRGDWAAMEDEISDGRRRARLYLVATDLSDEAIYALEWTIGTILRDGDTMIAMYAVDEEAANNRSSDSDAKNNAQIGEGLKEAQEMKESMAIQTEKTKQHPIVAHNPSALAPSPYMPATETMSLTGSVDARVHTKVEMERFHHVEDVSQTCIRLVRKTRLQVRIFVEVVHCKSPKHMLRGAVSVALVFHASYLLTVTDQGPRTHSRHSGLKR